MKIVVIKQINVYYSPCVCKYNNTGIVINKYYYVSSIKLILLTLYYWLNKTYTCGYVKSQRAIY